MKLNKKVFAANMLTLVSIIMIIWLIISYLFIILNKDGNWNFFIIFVRLIENR